MGSIRVIDITEENVVQIDVGKYLWKGINESVRVGWKIRLNIDMANKPAYMEEKLVEFIGNFLHSKMKDGCANMDVMIKQLSKDRDAIEKSNREIRDLKVRFERPDGAKRDYRMNKLVKNAYDQIMTKDDKSKVIKKAEKYFHCVFTISFLFLDFHFSIFQRLV